MLAVLLPDGREPAGSCGLHAATGAAHSRLLHSVDACSPPSSSSPDGTNWHGGDPGSTSKRRRMGAEGPLRRAASEQPSGAGWRPLLLGSSAGGASSSAGSTPGSPRLLGLHLWRSSSESGASAPSVLLSLTELGVPAPGHEGSTRGQPAVARRRGGRRGADLDDSAFDGPSTRGASADDEAAAAERLLEGLDEGYGWSVPLPGSGRASPSPRNRLGLHLRRWPRLGRGGDSVCERGDSESHPFAGIIPAAPVPKVVYTDGSWFCSSVR